VVDGGRGLIISWHIESTKCVNKMQVGTVLQYFWFFDNQTSNKIATFHIILQLKQLFLIIRKLLPVNV
jgi:hypothetical protein